MPSRSRPFDVFPDLLGAAWRTVGSLPLPLRAAAARPPTRSRYCRRTSASTASAAARRARSSATTASGALATKPWLPSLPGPWPPQPCAFCALLTRRSRFPLHVHQALEIQQRLDSRRLDGGEAPGGRWPRRPRPRRSRSPHSCRNGLPADRRWPPRPRAPTRPGCTLPTTSRASPSSSRAERSPATTAMKASMAASAAGSAHSGRRFGIAGVEQAGRTLARTPPAAGSRRSPR